LASMRPLVVIILCLTLGLLSSLSAVVEPTWQEPQSPSLDWAVLSVNSNPADESEFPDGAPLSLLRVKVFGKSAPVPKVRRARLCSVGTSPLKTQSHCVSHQDLFRREAVLRI
jgi:hypothetical protein